MKDYLKRVGICMVILFLFVGIIAAIVGCIVLWINVGNWLIPLDITYREWRQLAYITISIIIVLSFLFAIDKDNFE